MKRVSNEKILELLQRLIRSTRSGKVTWRETMDGFTALIDNAGVTIVADVPENSVPLYGLTIYDNRAQVLWSDTFSSTDALYPLTKELFAAIEQFDSPVDEFVDAMISKLK